MDGRNGTKMNDKILETLFKVIEIQLNSDNSWKHSHLEAVGETKERYPWVEDVWNKDKQSIIHWQNVNTPSHMSMHVPRHVWKIGITGTSAIISLSYGLAPFKQQNSPEPKEEAYDLSTCEQCGEEAYDGRICHACGMKEI